MARYSITAVLGVVTDGLRRGLTRARSSVASLGASFQGAMANPAVQAALQATRAIVDFGVEAVKVAGDIDAGMNEVFTLLPEMTEEAKEKMTQQMLDLSVKMGSSTKDMVDGIYGALSADIPEENVFSFMEQAARLGVAGVATTEDAMASITTIMNAYGMSAKEAGAISDSLFQTVKGGITTMPELSMHLGKAATSAATTGVSMQELNAMISTMTNQMGRGSTPQALTKIKVMIDELAKAGSKVYKSFEEISGKAFPDFMEAGGTTAQALQLLQTEAQRTGGRISDLFGSAEAGQAALILTNNEMKKFTKELKAQDNAMGVMDTAFEKVDQGFSRMMSKLMSGLEAFKYTVGTALTPVVNVVMPLFLRGLEMIQNLPWDTLGDFMGEIMEMIEPIIDALFELVRAVFPALLPLFKMNITLVASLLPMLMILIRLITAIMPAITWVLEKLALLADVVMKVTNWLTTLIGAIGGTKEEMKAATDEVTEGMGEVGESFGAVWDTIKDGWDWVKGAFEDLWGWITQTASDIAEFATQAWVLLSWPARKVYEAIAYVRGLFFDTLRAIWENIKDTVKKFFEIRQAVIDKIYETFPWLEDLVEGVKTFIKEKIMAIWFAIKDFFSGIVTGIGQLFADLREKVMTAEGETADALRYFWILAEEIGTAFIDLFKKAADVIGAVGGAVSWVAGKLGLAGDEAANTGAEIDRMADSAERAKDETAAGADEAEREGTARARAADHEERMASSSAVTAANLGTQAMNAEAVTRMSAQGLAQERLRRFQQQASVQAGARIIQQSGVNVQLLQATVGKHKDINDMAALYTIIAEGKKTPAELIEEAKQQQEALNRKGKGFVIRSPNGKTPAQQIKAATEEQGRLNAEAARNPLLNMAAGGMEVSSTVTVDPRLATSILEKLGGIHSDTTGIYNQLKGKFVNQ